MRCSSTIPRHVFDRSSSSKSTLLGAHSPVSEPASTPLNSTDSPLTVSTWWVFHDAKRWLMEPSRPFTNSPAHTGSGDWTALPVLPSFRIKYSPRARFRSEIVLELCFGSSQFLCKPEHDAVGSIDEAFEVVFDRDAFLF